MKTAGKVFRNLVENELFKEDILFLNKFNMLNQALDIYLQSEYRNYYHDNDKAFSKKINASIEDAHRLWHLIDFFSYTISPKFDSNTISKAVEELIGIKPKLKKFLKRLEEKQTQELLDEIDLIGDEIGNVNPRFKEIEYNIQERKVFKDDKVIKSFQVISLKIITNDEESNNNTFEILENDLDYIIEGFNNMKKKLKLTKGVAK